MKCENLFYAFMSQKCTKTLLSSSRPVWFPLFILLPHPSLVQKKTKEMLKKFPPPLQPPPLFYAHISEVSSADEVNWQLGRFLIERSFLYFFIQTILIIIHPITGNLSTVTKPVTSRAKPGNVLHRPVGFSGYLHHLADVTHKLFPHFQGAR